MLTIAGYTIDRISSITEQPGGATLQLESGQTCVIREPDQTQWGLVSWAKTSAALGSPMALFIEGGEVRCVSMYNYLAVAAVRPRDDDTLDVWLIGRNGNYSHSLKHHPDAVAHRALLLRGQETRFPLYLLINGPHIVAVIDLSAEQYEALAALGAIPNTLKPGVADSWIFGQGETAEQFAGIQ